MLLLAYCVSWKQELHILIYKQDDKNKNSGNTGKKNEERGLPDRAVFFIKSGYKTYYPTQEKWDNDTEDTL